MGPPDRFCDHWGCIYENIILEILWLQQNIQFPGWWNYSFLLPVLKQSMKLYEIKNITIKIDTLIWPLLLQNADEWWRHRNLESSRHKVFASGFCGLYIKKKNVWAIKNLNLNKYSLESSCGGWLQTTLRLPRLFFFLTFRRLSEYVYQNIL